MYIVIAVNNDNKLDGDDDAQRWRWGQVVTGLGSGWARAGVLPGACWGWCGGDEEIPENK